MLNTNISLVVPCYNEEEVLPATIADLTHILDALTAEGLINVGSEIVLVDDGSRDATWSQISFAASRNARVKGIRLAANRGHQNALLAGLEAARGDFVISIDADLQDDTACIREMILRHSQQGVDIAYGVRKSRVVDSFFKRNTAELFYHLMKLAGVKLVFNHADFRGMSRRALNALLSHREVNLFLRTCS
jgi:glycosyltransferase involved in cell wall biosynthesis